MNAVIDIGSNSVRLFVFETASDFSKGVTDLDITRLGSAINQTGRLSDESIKATWEVFDRFQVTMKQLGVDRVEAFATEAVRKASNSWEFVREIEDRYGWKVRVIDGEEEALIGFLGATFALPEGAYTVIDIGGASTEIIQGQADISFRKSFPIGALRYTDNPEMDLAEVFADLPPLHGQLAGIGGTITTILAMDLELSKYQREKIQGQYLKKASLEKWVNKLEAMSQLERQQIPGLHPKREPIIVAGMNILDYLMERFQQDTLVVSDYGNLEGYAISRGLCETNSL